jgi:DNA-binding CsgD family transcriptional regulator
MYHYQWQNPALRKTIYPFREKKLRDFLLIYEEIDLWKTASKGQVDQQLVNEITQGLTRLQNELAQAKQDRTDALNALRDLRAKHRQILNSPTVRTLAQQKINLEIKLAPLRSSIKVVKRRVDWYAQFAPEHPYYDKFTRQYETEMAAANALQADLDKVLAAYNAELAPFEAESKAQDDKFNRANERIAEATARIRSYPINDRNRNITQRMAVAWRMKKREEELEKLDHDALLSQVLARFDKEPQRFPKWLQYMVIHFSGMRYRSAHASWASPRDLIEALKIDEVKQRFRAPAADVVEREASQAIAELQREKSAIKDAKQIKLIDNQINRLQNPFQRQTALVNHLTAKKVADAVRLTDQQALDQLRSMKDKFPEWVWKEISARTALRLETTDENWETLTPQQQQERWTAENQRWSAILTAWSGKDITAWRQEHARTLQLIVSRAVCNEIAEHIQHLRGIKPAAGLTAKPVWYLTLQKKMPQQAYFRRAAGAADFKPGASILFLGWVDRQPNAWQIANPIAGVDLLGTSLQPPEKKSEKKTEKRRTQPGGFVNNGQGGLWLRWTHEAIVVEVAEMASGPQVLTFETGQIGLNLRPYWRMVNNWDIFVGYTPPADVPPAALAGMLDRQKILSKPAAPAEPDAGMLAFGLAAAPPPLPAGPSSGFPSAQLFSQLWNTLTHRQQEAAALFSQGLDTRAIADRLQIAVSTVNTHLRGAVERLNLLHRDEIKAWLSNK